MMDEPVCNWSGDSNNFNHRDNQQLKILSLNTSRGNRMKEIKVEKMFNRITVDKREVGYSEKERKILSGLGYGELLEINKAEEDGIIFNYDMKDNVYIKTYIK